MVVVLLSPAAAIALRMPKSIAEPGALTTCWVYSSFVHSSSSHAAMPHPTTSFSVARVLSNFFLCSVTSHASLRVCVAMHNMGDRIPISHPGTRTSCQPPDTYMNPYSGNSQLRSRPCRRNTQLSHRTCDWNPTRLLLDLSGDKHIPGGASKTPS